MVALVAAPGTTLETDMITHEIRAPAPHQKRPQDVAGPLDDKVPAADALIES